MGIMPFENLSLEIIFSISLKTVEIFSQNLYKYKAPSENEQRRIVPAPTFFTGKRNHNLLSVLTMLPLSIKDPFLIICQST